MGNYWSSSEEATKTMTLTDKMKNLEYGPLNYNHPYYAIRFLIKRGLQLERDETKEIITELLNEFNPNLIYYYPSEIIIIFDQNDITNEHMERKFERVFASFARQLYTRGHKNAYPQTGILSFDDFDELSLYLYWKIMCCIQENIHNSARRFVENTNGLKLSQMKEIIKLNDIPWENYEPSEKYGIFYKKTKKELTDKNGKTYYRTCEPTKISYNPHTYQEDELYDLLSQDYNTGF